MTTTSTPTLAEFLLARYSEDEAAARDAGGGQWRTDADGCCVYVDDPDGIRDPVETHFNGTAGHIARWDPARVLAECAKNRRIIAEYRARDNDVDLMLGPNTLRQREWSGLRLALQLLALPYADHEHYREEWRP